MQDQALLSNLRRTAIFFASSIMAALALAVATPVLAHGLQQGSGEPAKAADSLAPDRLNVELPATLASTPVIDSKSPVQQAREDMTALLGDDALEPGQFHWRDERVSTNAKPSKLLVSISDQRAYLYSGEMLVAVTTVSTGRAGHRTPTGTFQITEKRAVHFSSKYNNAPMPHMQRLTNDGIALHAGHIPGRPASHGCVRLPAQFAAKLFTITRIGTPVVIAA